jgi:hypothetical protein
LSEEFEGEIANLAYLETESLIEQYQLAKLRKIEVFSLVLHKALEEFKKRDFSETEFMKYCRFGIPLLSNLGGFYQTASVEIK